MARTKIPRKIQHSILIKSKRRCALCYHLNYDSSEKTGQIAHIDRNNENNNEDNLVFLCLEHHDKYDSVTSQSKRFLPEELTAAKTLLEKQLETDVLALLKTDFAVEHPAMSKVERVSFEVYQLRYPIYEVFRNFILSILQDADISRDKLSEFVKRTEDALFLYGEEINKYLEKVYLQAVQYYKTRREISQGEKLSSEEWEHALNKDEELLAWFEKELTNGKYLFAKYLQIA